jgi:hypothetical protein
MYKKTLKSFVSILDFEIFHLGLVNLVKTTVITFNLKTFTQIRQSYQKLQIFIPTKPKNDESRYEA